MPIAVGLVQRYRRTAEDVDAALGAPVDSGAATGPDPVIDAVQDYVVASRQVFGAAHSPDVELGVLCGDLRVLARLSDVAAASDGMIRAEAAGSAGYLDDIERVVALIEGDDERPTPLESGSADPAQRVSASLDGIVESGSGTMTGVVAAVALPSASELTTVVTDIFGAGTGAVFGTAVKAVQDTVNVIVDAIARVVGTVVEKIRELIGKPAIDDLTAWLQEVAGVDAVYAIAFGVPRLRAAADRLGPALDSERADRIALIEGSHARWQTWVRWGSRGLGAAGPTLRVVPQWGPIVLVTAAVALAVCSAWLTADHLDSFDLAWLPDRFPGVGAELR